MKNRLIVLTDICKGLENDDIESMVRLLLYSNEIELEGLISATSCWAKKAATEKEKAMILKIIDAYGKVKPNLDIHAGGYPTADHLRGKTFCGIPRYGRSFGDGFGESSWNENEGVQCIIDAVDKEDERPVWIAVWSGANTLAQAVWRVWTTRSEKDFTKFLSKLRIYAISDQDAGGHWLRSSFGDRLFYIVSPSPAQGSKYYRHASWPGISADRSGHGSSDSVTGKGFKGADEKLVSRRWLRRNIRSHGVYGKRYPIFRFIMEGDTPSYLSLIPNGLNCPEHPDYGGWGGRYEFYIPDPEYTGVGEQYPIWTNASDTVIGMDGKRYCSPQATIWRWRESFQHDFAARMDWCLTDRYQDANHPPVVKLAHSSAIKAACGEEIRLSAEGTYDPDGGILEYRWFHYREAGTYDGDLTIEDAGCQNAFFVAPCVSEKKTIHIILAVTDNGVPPLTRYQRVMITIEP